MDRCRTCRSLRKRFRARRTRRWYARTPAWCGDAMKRLLVLAAILTLSLTRTTAQQPPARPADPARPAPSSSGLQLDALDRSADACTDFYQFACGGWIAKNPVPADRSGWGRFDELQEHNNDVLHRILETAAAGRDPESKKIGDYYASCMDETAIDAKGPGPPDPLLEKIAPLPRVTALAPPSPGRPTAGATSSSQFVPQPL